MQPTFAIRAACQGPHVTSEEPCHRDAAARVEQQLRALFAVDLVLQADAAAGLSARMSAYRGRSLRFADLHLSAHSTCSAGVLRGGESRVLLSLHRAGPVVVEQGGRCASIEPGQMFLVDPAAAFRITTGEIQTLSVYLSRPALLARVPALAEHTAVPIPCSSGAGAILRATVEALFQAAGSLDEDTADRLADALPYLLAPALLAQWQDERPAPSRLHRLHLERIRRHVAEHLGDPGLSATSIAQAVGLSPRHVYELFADEPEPLMKWVWAQRLDRCRRDLAEPRLRARSVGEVAYAWGFSDLSHFSRAFKQRFGVSPRRFRQGGVAQSALSSSP